MSWHGVICPVCGEALVETARVLRCRQGHAFDVAREGYVNLLRWRGKPPKILGDATAMLHARRRFLERGWYAPLVDLVAGELGDETAVLLDAGCGEGYYARQLAARFPRLRLWGMDIAKTAVRLAAKQFPNARFFAADVHQQIPLETASMDAILNIFAPRNAGEFARLLRVDGRLLITIPGPDHLAALRQQFDLLTIEIGKQEKITAQMNRDFELERVRPVSIPLELTQTDVADLLQMTPNEWHWTDKQQAQLETITRFQDTASFCLLHFRRR